MKRISIGARCAALIMFFFCSQAFAINEWFELYSNTRSLGMGGASVAVTSDETALYRNPANLGSVRDVYGTILDPELEGSSNFVKQVTSNSTGKAFEIEEIKNNLDSNREAFYHAKAQVSPSIVRRNFGFGLLMKNDVSAETEATGSTMDLASIGSEGTGFSFDGGLLIQMPWIYLPTLGAVVRDIGDTQFDKQDGFRLRANSRPETVKQSVDAAIAIFPIHSNMVRSVWTLEYSDVTNSRNDTDTMKRAHFGMEINTRDIFFFRLGYNQRYWTAGFEIASERFQWQVSSYGEEIGTELAPREDRRLSTKFALRF